MGSTWVVIGSSNGSSNYGDEMMWMNLVQELRRNAPGAKVVTDAFPHWSPPYEEIEVLPFPHVGLMAYRMRPSRIRMVNKFKAAFGLAVNRGARQRGYRRAAQIRAGAPLAEAELVWDEALSRSRGLVFSGAGGITDRFALHAIAGWGVLVALADRRRVPVVFVGQGVGPVVEQAARDAAGQMLQSADWIGTREKFSAREVIDLAPGVEVRTQLDWAVVTRTPPEVDDRVRAWVKQQELAGCVAISVHDWTSATEEERARVRSLVRGAGEFALAKGLRVLCVPNCVGTFRADDRAFMQAEIAHLPEHLAARFQQTPDDFRAYETRRALREARVLFTTRYHPLVFALSEGTPAVGLAYDDYYIQKHRGALAWYDMESWVDDVRLLSPDLNWWEAHYVKAEEFDRTRLRARTETLRDAPRRSFEEWVAARKGKDD